MLKRDEIRSLDAPPDSLERRILEDEYLRQRKFSLILDQRLLIDFMPEIDDVTRKFIRPTSGLSTTLLCSHILEGHNSLNENAIH